MKLKYYFMNSAIGLFFFAMFVYGYNDFFEGKMLHIIDATVFASAVFFPFAKLAFTRLALRFSDREQWERGIFSDPRPRGMYILPLWLGSYVMAIPVGVPYAIYLIIRNSRKAETGLQRKERR